MTDTILSVISTLHLIAQDLAQLNFPKIYCLLVQLRHILIVCQTLILYFYNVWTCSKSFSVTFFKELSHPCEQCLVLNCGVHINVLITLMAHQRCGHNLCLVILIQFVPVSATRRFQELTQQQHYNILRCDTLESMRGQL